MCLPIALELGRLYHDEKFNQRLIKENKMPPWQLMRYTSFEKLKNNEQRQRELGLQIMRAAKIPINMNDYGIEELELIQKFYDKIYPNMYRIIAFSDETGKMPIW